MREPQAELMLAIRSSISRSAADGGRGSCCCCVGVCSGAALARLHPLLLLLPALPTACRRRDMQSQGQGRGRVCRFGAKITLQRLATRAKERIDGETKGARSRLRAGQMPAQYINSCEPARRHEQGCKLVIKHHLMCALERVRKSREIDLGR